MVSEKRLSPVTLLASMAQKMPRVATIEDACNRLDNIPADLPRTIGHVLEENAQKYRDKPAIYFEDITLSHFEFNALCNQYANYFWEQGVRKGTVVVVFLENRLATLILIAALGKLGAVASLINPNQRGKVLKHSIEIDQGNFFVIGENLYEAFEAVKSTLILSDSTLLFGLKDKGRKEIPDNYLPLTDLVSVAARDNPAATKMVKLGDRFANVFTSGTTGMPKASIQTHQKWYVCYLWYGTVCLNLKEDDVMYVPLPFFHTNAIIVAWPAAAAAGAAMTMRRKLSISNFWKDVKKFDVSAFIYIGEVCRYLFNKPSSSQDTQHRIRKIIGNGLRPDIWKAFKKRFNISEVYELYGASDSTVLFTNVFNLDCTVGLCRSTYAIVKYDTDQDSPYRNEAGLMERVAIGETGLAIGKFLATTHFPGYVNKEKNKEKILENVFEVGDKWFDTGDLLRDIGYHHAQFVDRIGDTFRWKGENVSTAELEGIINNLPNVAHSAVYGVDLPKVDGRAGMATIMNAVPLNEFDFVQFSRLIKEQLPSYAVPLFLRFIDDFKKTATHKIQKSKLKQESIWIENATASIYVLLPKSDVYQPISKQLLRAIKEGSIAF